MINVSDFISAGMSHTVAIQTALDVLSDLGYRGGHQAASGTVFIPEGEYQIGETLLYTGNVSRSLHLVGELGTKLRWNGPPGLPIMRLVGACHSDVERIVFDGVRSANNLLWFDNTHDGSDFYSSSDCRVLRCYTQNPLAGGAGLAIGNASNNQVSELMIDSSYFLGSDINLLTSAGIRLLGGGNVKNIHVKNSRFDRCGTGYDGPGSPSGASQICSSQFSNCAVGISSPGVAKISSCGMENDGVPGRFVVSVNQGCQPGGISIENCYAVMSCPEDDFLMDLRQQAFLTGNYFENQRTPTAEAKIKVSGLQVTPDMGVNTAWERSGITSRHNTYINSYPYAPLWDASGNALLGSGYRAGRNQTLESFADWGGGVNNPAFCQLVSLRPTIGLQMEVGSLAPPAP